MRSPLIAWDDRKSVVDKEIVHLDNSSEDAGPAKRQPRGKKGTSGSPKGKALGTRNTSTLAAEALLDGECEGLTLMLIEMAKGKNIAAMRFVMPAIA